MDERDLEYLARALDLAEKGKGCTSPNPIVGAVIVRDGLVLGEGWHAGAGLDHAEVSAIRDALAAAGLAEVADAPVDWASARSVLSGSTMYVTLEPCCTHGRTPPCTTALVNSGFSRVVAAAIDPSPGVNGLGLESLRGAGIAVEVAEGEINHRARRQNNGVRKTIATGLPFVTYKYAMTLDGRVATDSGDARWISSQESRTLVHRWRAWSDAVVVGAGTARDDDPTLTAREVGCATQPLRVVIDSECGLSSDSGLVRSVQEGPVMLVCGEGASPAKRDELRTRGVTVVTAKRSDNGGVDPVGVCKILVERGVQSVLLEGGPRLAGAWWSAGLIDKVATFVAPKVVSGETSHGPLFGMGIEKMNDVAELQEIEVQRIGPDVLITGYTGGPY